jgi:hypothetical protein
MNVISQQFLSNGVGAWLGRPEQWLGEQHRSKGLFSVDRLTCPGGLSFW